MKRARHLLVRAVGIAHAYDGISDANLRVVHHTVGRLHAIDFLGSECFLQEFDHRRRAQWIHIWGHTAESFENGVAGGRLADVPAVAAHILYRPSARAIVLIGYRLGWRG